MRLAAPAPVARQIDDVHAKLRSEQVGQRRKDAAMHGPAVDQHEVGTASLDIDMHRLHAA